MFDIGFLELMVVAILGLLVLGPERLPKAARTVGLFLGRMRRTMSNIQDDLERQVRTEELREKLKDPYATFLDDDSPSANSIQPKPKAETQPDNKPVAVAGPQQPGPQQPAPQQSGPQQPATNSKPDNTDASS
ncbi:twin-arginine translocase subunit TatB [Thalassolituus sp. ST750PaO-4]|uniref:Sec-independent protein translocase protein TatB n=1 Tax=Thalassolituus sp. ST750PaO-4 TaxID=2742965 RepID=UPI001CE3225E|nr:Sec-independent protein translocase protein TatB [Thalassolituus sp. ST750PaO-4]MCA6059227.1 twin-arginine translocase subunit TatB [Thalassolituus sp. ST750PaO-4]